MSIRVLSQVWEHGPEDKSELLVLLALADFANDAGECWPSVATIAAKARMSVRGVQTVSRRLIDAGWLEIDAGNGRNNCNQYRVINTAGNAPRRKCTPQQVQGLDEKNPAPDDINPAAHDINPAPGAPKPSRTVKNRHSNNKNARETLLEVAGPDAVDSFMAYRRGHKSKALTETGAKRLAKHLREIFDSGGDPDDALAMAEERGWASVQPDWYFNAKGKRNDRSIDGTASARAERVAERWAAKQAQSGVDFGPGGDASQPLLSAPKPH